MPGSGRREGREGRGAVRLQRWRLIRQERFGGRQACRAGSVGLFPVQIAFLVLGRLSGREGVHGRETELFVLQITADHLPNTIHPTVLRMTAIHHCLPTTYSIDQHTTYSTPTRSLEQSDGPSAHVIRMSASELQPGSEDGQLLRPPLMRPSSGRARLSDCH